VLHEFYELKLKYEKKKEKRKKQEKNVAFLSDLAANK
jgi:hypothetical protein